MRNSFSRQFGSSDSDGRSLLDVELDFECCDEIAPILRCLQHIDSQPELQDRILNLVAVDVKRDSCADCGRQDPDYWEILESCVALAEAGKEASGRA